MSRLVLQPARVAAIDVEHSDLQTLHVEIEHSSVDAGRRRAIHFPDLHGPVRIGDRVLVNSQSVELGLGSGGFDIVHVLLPREGGEPPTRGAHPDDAHVMLLNYTSLQHAVPFVEEALAEVDEFGSLLGSCSLVASTVHSQIAPVIAGVRSAQPDAQIWYVQQAGGALPMALSDTVRTLRDEGHIRGTVAVSPCLPGGAARDYASVDVHGALAWCARQDADVIVTGIGPGVVGTASTLGHGGLSAVAAIRAARSLGCPATVLAPRRSAVDRRERHRGLSHHSSTVAALVGMAEDELPHPVNEEVLSASRAASPVRWSTMGRSCSDDPVFFASAVAAGIKAAAAGGR